MSNQQKGRDGERLALDLLKKSGYRILKRNYRSPYGEIDIIARDGQCYCFVEVKSRSCDRFGLPQEALDFSKRRRMQNCALDYLKKNGLLDHRARFDVVSIIGAPAKKADLIKNAFDAD